MSSTSMAGSTSPVKLPAKLSPSRIKDFMQCPKLFEFKLMGLSTPPTEATAKGTLTHHVFERIFDHPRGERSLETALSYVRPAWAMMLNPLIERSAVTSAQEVRLRDEARYWRELHESGSPSETRLMGEAADYRTVVPVTGEDEFIQAVEDCVRGWYRMENPDKFDPMEREFYVTSQISGVSMHGYIDRLDKVELGAGTRYYISDYKTGRPPSDRFQDEAFFQLAVYAVLVENQLGVRPFQLRLIYVREGRQDAVLTRVVTSSLLAETRKKIANVWRDIQRASQTSEWEPRKQTLCGWCFFQSVCPAYAPEAGNFSPEEIAARTGARVR